MSVDERRRLELADAAKRVLGDDAGIALMELLPPVGWADVATRHDVLALEGRMDARFESFEGRMDARFESLEGRMDAKLESFEGRMDAKFESCEHKLTSAFHQEMVVQTWRYVAAMGVLFTLFSGVMTALVRL